MSQRKQVTIAKENAKQAEAALPDRKSAAAGTLGRSTVHDASLLKSELKEARKEHRNNEKAITSIRSSVVAKGLETESLHEEAIVGEKLKHLWSLNFDLKESKPQWVKLVNESQSRFKGLPPKLKYGACVFAGVMSLLVMKSLLDLRQNTASQNTASQTPPADSAPLVPITRILAIVVPGTYGNEGNWPRIIPGSETFASLLLEQLPPGSEVYPFLWASSVFHGRREEAAANLAQLIDKKAHSYDRIVLVGHSHGGNVCLMAAARCSTQIDAIICLSTPHVYLDTDVCYLPVYCSCDTLQRTRMIISITANNDNIVDGWADIFTGLTENVAIELTNGWRERLNFPRLKTDSFLSRLLGSGNLMASRTLAVGDDNIKNLTLYTLGSDGEDAHSHVHSRRMGTLLGRAIANGSAAAYATIKSTVLTKSTMDFGEPIQTKPHEPAEGVAIWLVESISLRFDSSVNALDQELGGGGGCDPFIELLCGDCKQKTKHVEDHNTNDECMWTPNLWVFNGQQSISVNDSDGILGQHQIGVLTFEPPSSHTGHDAVAVSIVTNNRKAWGEISLRPLFE